MLSKQELEKSPLFQGIQYEEYLRMLSMIENGGAAYRQQAGAFRGFTLGGDPCTNLCLCYLFNLFCCGGRGFFLCC